MQGPTGRSIRAYFTEKKSRRSHCFAKANGLKISPIQIQKTRGNQHLDKLQKNIGLLEPSTSASVDPLPKLDASEGLNLPPFESVSCWSSSGDPLPDFTFMHLYCYLIKSKDKSFDSESFKSLKAYKYFADRFIQNVCMYPVDGADYLYTKLEFMLSSTKGSIIYHVCLHPQNHWTSSFSQVCLCCRVSVMLDSCINTVIV